MLCSFSWAATAFVAMLLPFFGTALAPAPTAYSLLLPACFAFMNGLTRQGVLAGDFIALIGSVAVFPCCLIFPLILTALVRHRL